MNFKAIGQLVLEILHLKFSFLVYSFLIGRYPCTIQIWNWLNPKGHFKRSNLAPFLLGGNFLKNCSITFSLFIQEASQGGY